jgi:hypothetical protein
MCAGFVIPHRDPPPIVSQNIAPGPLPTSGAVRLRPWAKVLLSRESAPTGPGSLSGPNIVHAKGTKGEGHQAVRHPRHHGGLGEDHAACLVVGSSASAACASS